MNRVTLMGAGVLTAITASLCCITPVLALIAGSSSIASSFSWIEPARPYLIGVTVAVLAFAWYQKLKPKPVDECGCALNDRPKLTESKTFLSLVTVFATLMLAFPSYAKVFFPKNEKQVTVVNQSSIQTTQFKIRGMSCSSCEEEVKHEVNKLNGIIKLSVSYAKGDAEIQFDNSKTNVAQITQAINSTGYTVNQTSIKK